MRLVNGVLAESLSLNDRAIQFGDGVFRTIKVSGGRIIWWPEQYAKLVSDCAQIGISAPSEATLLADISQLAQLDLSTTDYSIKIIITRGESLRGYAAAADLAANRIVLRAPLPAYPAHIYSEGVTLHVCATRASWQPALAGIKHLNRLENVIARCEWSDPVVFDGVMLDRDGHVIEGVMSNLFAFIDGELITPLLNESGVSGVCRAKVLLVSRHINIPTKEVAFNLEQLCRADAVLLCNSLVGCVPVREVAEQRWNVSQYPEPIRHLLAYLKAEQV